MSPLRSNMMLFDLMYRTNAKGRVSGYAFEATSVESENSRITTWRAPEIPLSLAMPYLGSGARFIEGGSIDVSVEDRWIISEGGGEDGSEDGSEISMHYRVVLRDLQVAIPDDLGPSEKALALPLALAVKSSGGRSRSSSRSSSTRSNSRGRSPSKPSVVASRLGGARGRDDEGVRCRAQGPREVGHDRQGAARRALDD